MSAVGEVQVLDLGADENRLNPDWVDAVGALLDDVEKSDGPRALVVKGSGKFWSNGLDLDWITAHPAEADRFLAQVHRLFARVLALPVPTAAAITGHAFAAGAMLAVAHDFQIMRRDRGFWCCPEVDLGLPFTAGMNALLLARLSRRTAHEAMTTGRRYTAEEAWAAGIINSAADEAAVVETAVELVAPLVSKAGPTLGAIKTQMYAEAIETLRNGAPRFPRTQ